MSYRRLRGGHRPHRRSRGRRATRRRRAAAEAASEKLVYADFEGAEGGKPVSARGGAVSLTSYPGKRHAEHDDKGAPDGSTSPELVRIKPDDPNHLAKFEFALMAPNSYAGAGIEIKGQPDADGKTPADDVTGFRKITFQLYAKGAEMSPVEAISRGHGVDLPAGYPQKTYQGPPRAEHLRGAAEGLAQPGGSTASWIPKKILQKLQLRHAVAAIATGRADVGGTPTCSARRRNRGQGAHAIDQGSRSAISRGS